MKRAENRLRQSHYEPLEYLRFGRLEAVFWTLIVVAWTYYLFFGPGEW